MVCEKTSMKSVLKVHIASRVCNDRAGFFLLGLLVVSSLGIITLGTTNLFERLLLQAMALRNGTVLFHWWKNIPVEPQLSVYVYNYTNVNEFLQGMERLRVEEVGPYVYKEIIEKTNLHYNEDNTITFQEKRHLEFMPELSAGDLDDILVLPNLSVLSAASFLQNAFFLLKIGFSSYMTTMSMKPFVILTAQEFLSGYKDPVFDMAQALLPKKSRLPIENFGLLARINTTYPDKLTIHTGVDDISLLGQISRINGRTKMNIWEDPECDRVDGYEQSLYPRLLERNTRFEVYKPEVCRLVRFLYNKDTYCQGMPALQFAFEDLVTSVDGEVCRCREGDSISCSPAGLLDISPCVSGAPFVISYPRFYLGDPNLRKMVDGILPPTKEKHESYINIHRRFGLPLSGVARIQLNIAVKKQIGIRHMNVFKEDLILPIAWGEEAVFELPATIVALAFMATYASHIMIFIFAVVALSSLFVFVKRGRSSKMKKCKNSTYCSLTKLDDVKL